LADSLFSVVEPIVWNSLPVECHCLPMYILFCSCFKTFLFAKFYSSPFYFP